jgi:hypothetical protein
MKKPIQPLKNKDHSLWLFPLPYSSQEKFAGQINDGLTQLHLKSTESHNFLVVIGGVFLVLWRSMAANENKLKQGERLNPGEQLISNNRQYVLIYQGDGNLVIYDTSKIDPANPTAPGLWIWDAGTVNHRPGFVVLQGDGNLCVYDSVGHGVTCTMTVNDNWKGVLLVLQDDGNLVLHGFTPVFQSFTSKAIQATTPPQPAPPSATPPNPAPQGSNLIIGALNVLQTVETVADVVSVVVSLF